MGESGEQSTTSGADGGDKNKPQRTPNESPTGTDETGTETDKNGKKAAMKPPSIFPRKSLLVAATT
jgi:hypothetical protein